MPVELSYYRRLTEEDPWTDRAFDSIFSVLPGPNELVRAFVLSKTKFITRNAFETLDFAAKSILMPTEQPESFNRVNYYIAYREQRVDLPHIQIHIHSLKPEETETLGEAVRRLALQHIAFEVVNAVMPDFELLGVMKRTTEGVRKDRMGTEQFQLFHFPPGWNSEVLIPLLRKTQ